MALGFKYIKVRETLLADAKKTANYRLPSERELCKQYKVSRNTAKKALNSLFDDRIVTRTVGRGTFFVPSKIKHTISILSEAAGWQTRELIANECKNFSKRYSNIELKVISVKHGDITKTARSLPGAKIVLSPNIGFMAEYGLLAPLDGMKNFKGLGQDINTQYLDWFQFNGRKTSCYSLPLLLRTNMCGINKKHAQTLGFDSERGPETFEGLLNWCKTVDEYNKQAGKIKIWSTHAYEPVNNIINQTPPIAFYLTLAKGKNFIQEKNGEASFEFDFGHEWIEFFKKINRTKSILHGNTLNYADIIEQTLFNHRTGQWSIKELENANKLNELAVIECPTVSPMGKSYTNSSKVSMGIIEDGQVDHPARKMAWEFMKYLVCRVEPQRKIGEFFTSVNKTVFSEQTKNPQLYPFIQALSTSTMQSDHPVQHSIMKILRKYFYDAIYDKISVDDAVSRINEMCNLQLEIESEHAY